VTVIAAVTASSGIAARRQLQPVLLFEKPESSVVKL